MKRIFILFSIFCTGLTVISNAQSASGKLIDSFNPSIVRNVYEIIKYIPLTEEKQIALAKLIAEEDVIFAKKLKEEKVISTIAQNALTKLRKDNLQKILTEQELDQYYRGISDKEAEAMAADVRDKVKIQLKASYQESKFIYASFYKIYLESKVAEIKYADKPKILESVLKKIKDDELKVLMEKSGLSVDENLIAKRVWTFKPNTPLR